MKLRASGISIPDGDPFREDLFERKPLIEGLSALVSQVTPPFVICIDAPWGFGKTTFLRLWEAAIPKSNIKVLYFNAWETDFTSDPLAAFVGEISTMAGNASNDGVANKSVKKLKTIASKIAKRAVPVAIQVATAGILKAGDFTEEAVSDLASELTVDAIEAYEAQKTLVRQFQEALQQLVSELPSKEDARLLILVDELDRCRPTYTLELLERIKHIFDVPNVVFALALDKRQICISIEAVYGQRIDSQDYLRRFIDLEVDLPRPKDGKAFTDVAFSQFGLQEVFSKRQHPELQYDLPHLKGTLIALSDLFDLSLRTRQQLVARLRVVFLATANDEYIYPDALAALLVLRTVAAPIFRRFVSKEGMVTDVLNCLRQQADGTAYVASKDGALLEAFLIAAKGSQNVPVPEREAYDLLLKTEKGSSDDPKRDRAEQVVEFLNEMRRRRGQTPNLDTLRSRIELAANISAK